MSKWWGSKRRKSRYVAICITFILTPSLSAGDSISSEYAFLDSMVIGDDISAPVEPLSVDEWQFSIEHNNTGDTDESSRLFFSLSKYQLLAMDDSFALGIETNAFDDQHAINWAYDSTSVGEAFSALWIIQLTGSYNVNHLEDESTSESVTDLSWDSGVYVSSYWADENIMLDKSWSLQWGIGARWQVIDIGAEQFFEEGSRSQFLLPGLNVRWLQTAYSSQSEGYFAFERNMGGAAKTENVLLHGAVCVGFFTVEKDGCIESLDGVSDLDIGEDFQLLTVWFQHGVGLGSQGYDASRQRVVMNVRGQYSFGERLLPHFQYSLGGLYSIRGYEEQLVAGDDALEMTLEYRYSPIALTWMQGIDGWLIVFYDWGKWQTNPQSLTISTVDLSAQRWVERNGDNGIIRSWGAGVELSFWKQSPYNAHLYLAWGKALEDDGIEVNAGESRLHGYFRVSF
mgnify:CR=1 FL=1